MNTIADPTCPPPIPALSGATRVRSIDIFRGLTMLVMIFVNDVASVKGLPWWTYHMSPKTSGMTYVDVVFPAFLFVLGMSIPLAVKKRLEQGQSMLNLSIHILMRTFSLVVLGLILANAGKADPQATGMPHGAWATLALIGAILFWLVYPRSSGRQTLYRALKYAGLALLVVMLAIFRRRTATGDLLWLDFGYWEILGLIGRAYLAGCILYIPLRKKIWAPMAVFVALNAWNVASRFGLPSVHSFLPYALWPFDAGELPSVVMAGTITSSIFIDTRLASTFRRKVEWALGFAALLFVSGWMLSFLGISKNAATPTWCLYCSGISVVLFLAIYWLADVRQKYGWAVFVKPAGANTLLTYLLPDIFYFTLGAVYLTLPGGAGWLGMARSAVFTACILGVSYLLTRRKIRMQL